MRQQKAVYKIAYDVYNHFCLILPYSISGICQSGGNGKTGVEKTKIIISGRLYTTLYICHTHVLFYGGCLFKYLLGMFYTCNAFVAQITTVLVGFG